MRARNGRHMAEYQRAKRVVYTQILLSGVLTIVFLPFDASSARDALCGGVVATTGSLITLYFVSGQYQAARPDAIVRRLYLGQLARFSVIAGMFLAMMLMIDSLNPVALLATFFIVQVLPLVTFNFYDRKTSFAQRR